MAVLVWVVRGIHFKKSPFCRGARRVRKEDAPTRKHGVSEMVRPALSTRRASRQNGDFEMVSLTKCQSITPKPLKIIKNPSFPTHPYPLERNLRKITSSLNFSDILVTRASCRAAYNAYIFTRKTKNYCFHFLSFITSIIYISSGGFHCG